MNPFLYEAQQQRNPVPMLIEKMAQLLELLHYEQKTADGWSDQEDGGGGGEGIVLVRCLGDWAKSNSLVANMRQLNLDLSGKKNVMASYKSQLVGRVLQVGKAAALSSVFGHLVRIKWKLQQRHRSWSSPAFSCKTTIFRM